MTQEQLNKKLFKASKDSNFSEVEKYIQAGADVHATDFIGCTTLHFACTEGCEIQLKY